MCKPRRGAVKDTIPTLSKEKVQFSVQLDEDLTKLS